MAQRRQLHDRYFRQAKADGYLARSAYKLLQIQERRRLIRPGDRVLDLGCAPGSWLQVASEATGERGIVVGIDLTPVEHPMPAHVRSIVADVFAVDPAHLLELAGGPFDVVLSDMAPGTTGAGDHYPSVDLCRRVLELLPPLLRPAGGLAMKVFEGELYPALLRDTAALFEDARGFRPEATRSVSREIYILAQGYRADRRAGAAPIPARRQPPRPGAGWGGAGAGGRAG